MNDFSSTLFEKLRFGVTPAMATPMAADGCTVDTAQVPPLVEFLLARQVAALFVGGTTGEGILLDVPQRQRLHAAAVQAAAGRVPVIVHVGGNRTDVAVSLAIHAAEIGATAVAAVTPTFYPAPDDALASYYLAIAAAIPEMPLLLYDIPHMAINGVSPALFSRLARELPTPVGVKSSRADAEQVRQLIAVAPPGQLVLVGNERLALGLLAAGAHGMISGLSTAVPEPFVALTRAIGADDMGAARQAQQRIHRLLDQIPPGARLGAIKQVLAARGVPVGDPVPPRPATTMPVWEKMQAVWE